MLQCYGGRIGSVDADRPAWSSGAVSAINKCYLKPYPCCRFLHPAIDALLKLCEQQGIHREDILEVEVDTYAAAADLRAVGWDTLFTAQLSFPYTLAVAIERGEVGPAGYADAARRDANILRHVPKIVIREDARMTAAYPEQACARVVVRTRNGQRHREVVVNPLGSPENPLTAFPRATDPRSSRQPISNDL